MLVLAGMVCSAFAANPSGPLRIQVIAAPNFVVDSNAGTPASQSPRSAFIGARFYNDGLTDLTNLVAYIGNYNGGSGSIVGVFPSRSHSPLVGPLPGGQFALKLESGSAGIADATRKLGTLKAGQSVTVYWLVSYPILDTVNRPVWGSGPDPSDDLWLNYDIWAAAQEGATSRMAAQTTKATMRNEISAMANKIYPNTANQVPDQYKDMLQQFEPTWTNVPADGSVGTRIVAEGIWYMLGNVGSGYDCDGDLVFDHDAWLQPVGNPALFDVGAFRLAKTYTMLIVQLKSGGEQVILAEDQLYFKDLPENTSVAGYVRYEFVPIISGITSQLTPYQEAASGSNNEKFNGDYGAVVGGGLAGEANQIQLDKTVNLTNAVAGQTLQYKITYTNAGVQAIGNPGDHLPLVIIDSIPTGTTYVAGSAYSSNTLPSSVSNYTILYSTNNGVAWSASEPAASSVTDIQWWLSDAFNPAATGGVQFSVQVKTPYTNAPQIANTAGTSIGNNPPFLTDTAVTRIQGNNTLGDLVFADTGVGGGFLGDGLQDGTEPGLSNILVSVYFDANGNGILNEGDFLAGSARSSTSGYYIVSNLVDGYYIARVDVTDANLPAGYTLTTSNSLRVALDPAFSTTNSVSGLTADFGFAPALGVTKTLPAGGPLYEGRALTYTIAVTNNLPGDGGGGSAPFFLTVWSSNLNAAQTSTGWVDSTNAIGQPNGTEATDSFISNPNDYLALTDFRSTPPTGSAISNVQVMVPLSVVTPWRAGDEFAVTLTTSAGVEFYRKSYTGHTALASGTLVLDVTTNRAWQWADFNSSNVCIRLVCSKGGGNNQGGWVGVDAAAFRVRSSLSSLAGSSANTLDPVPLKDLYDTNRLAFVSASPSPSSVTATGSTGYIVWNNLGPLAPGAGRTISLTFKALEPAGNAAALVTNTASVLNAFFANGRPANTGVSQVATNLLPTGVIGDTVWRDENRNGIQETNEAGIAGVQVVLQPPANVDLGSGVGVSLTNTTDRNGYYLFEGIASTGRFVVTVRTNTLPAGATNTWSEMSGLAAPTNVTAVTNFFPASLTGLDVHRTADFGYSWTGSTIHGYLWNDLDASAAGTADPGEPGFTNVTVYLYNATNLSVAIGTNRTDASGHYVFTGSYSGSYVVVATTNSGNLAGLAWRPTFDTDGLASTNRVTVPVLPGKTAQADFSYFQTGPYAIGDTLFFDWNGNGVRDAYDEGIPNIPLGLYRDLNANGVVDAGTDPLVAVTNTDSAGHYLFSNMPPGAFLVEVRRWAPAFPSLMTQSADPDGARDSLSLVTLLAASDYAQDFGYQPGGSGSIGDRVWRDVNADGVQAGAQETGITNVPVRLYVDLNGDGSYLLLASTNTDANGAYLFANLPAGAYRVEVDASSPALPKDVFGLPAVPTTPTSCSVTLSGAASLMNDFGFAALGAIGDTIFWDNNANGSQDWTERGITGVTVNLYRDLNGNGVYDDGTNSLAGSRVTDTNGAYLFTGLAAGPYVVLVVTNGALTNATLTAAPALDGQPLTNSAQQALYSQYGWTLTPGQAYMGADFGFQPKGVLGKMVWLDSNANGVREDGEPGVAGAVLVLSNATAVITNVTDADGYYSFGNMADGAWTLRVLTNAAGFPFGLAPTYDPDGTNSASLVSSIVVSNGHVVSVDGAARTNFDLMLDFGYRYSGNNALSGTVGLDGFPTNGVLGTGASGVSADEIAFAGVSVYLYVWRDLNTNGSVDQAETTYIGSTQTATNGDYAFTGLPSAVGPGTNRYLVSLAAPDVHLALTTLTGLTPALSVVPTTNSLGEALSAYQVLAIAPVITNVDFAFRSTWTYDYGDLPSSYSTLQGDSPSGPRHRLPVVPVLYLGAGVTGESDGQPSAAANLDTNDDGVVTAGLWQDGASGALVRVTVNGSGWLGGYVDYNRNGTFADAGEYAVGQAVTAGVYSIWLTVPAGTVQAGTNTALYARFRLFPREPGNPALSYTGSENEGEAEDYLWTFGAIGRLVWEDDDRDGVQDPGESGLAGVRVFADLNSNGVWNAGEPASTTDAGGVYGLGGFPAGDYRIAVDTSSLPVGLMPVFDRTGPADGLADVTLASGAVNTNTDFGYDYPSAGVQLVKTAGAAGDGSALAADYGSAVTYRYHVVNSGESYLVNLAVSDDKLGSVGTVLGPLAPGAAVDLYATNLDVRAGVINIGTVSATPATSNGVPIAALGTVTDTDDAVVELATQIRGVVWKENGGTIDGVKSNDAAYPAVGVQLLAGGTNGAVAASATTDVSGAFAFTNITTGVAYAVRYTVPKTNGPYFFFAPNASYVVADGTNRSTIGNDAVFHSISGGLVYAYAAVAATQIVYGSVFYVDAGLGTNDPTHTLSTAISLRLYETADGLFVELCTVDEVVDGEPIVLYIRDEDGRRRKIGEVISLGGSQRYLIPVDRGLFRESPVTLVVVDESGATHVLSGLSIAEFKATMTRMDKQGLTLAWDSLPGRVYDVYMSERATGPWRKVVVNVEAGGLACSTVVPIAGRSQGFFKIVMQEP